MTMLPVLVSLLLWVSGPQARDAGTQTVVRTSVLAGRVVTPGDAPRPVRRAIVTLSGDAITNGLATVTDDEGEFVFRELPAGRFTITATRPAHLPAVYGATQPGRAGVPVSVAAGERRVDLVLVMAKAAVVSGTLATSAGTPLTGVEVSAFRLPASGNLVAMALAGSAVTDDRGMYRIFDLSPGDYVVAARPQSRVAGNGDAAQWSTQQLDRILHELEQRRAVATVAAPAAPEPMEAETRLGWAPVYFPGVGSPQDAVTIRLRPDDDRTGLDFSVAMQRMARVELSISGDTAVLQTARVFFNATGRRLLPLVAVTPLFASRMTASSREVTYTGVPPGTYAITVHVPGAEPHQTQWARTEFTVASGGLTRLNMSLQPGLAVGGRLVFQGVDEIPADALRGATVSLVAANGIGQAASGSTLMGNPIVRPATVDSSGAFRIDGVVPETFTLRVAMPNGKPWTPVSALHGGQDVLDTPMTVASSMDGIVVSLSSQPTRLDGRLLTSTGDPGASLFIAVFPQDRTLWSPTSRRITSARASTDGHWHLDGLPPGDYFVVALSDLAPEELLLPEFLDQLAPVGLRVSLAPGEKRTQDLMIR